MVALFAVLIIGTVQPSLTSELSSGVLLNIFLQFATAEGGKYARSL